jgi:hypothetical protein
MAARIVILNSCPHGIEQGSTWRGRVSRVGANLIFLAVDDWWAGRAKKGMLSAQRTSTNIWRI